MTIGLTGFAASPGSAHHGVTKTTFFEHANRPSQWWGGGGYLDVEAGSGVHDPTSRNTCWWGACPTFDNAISSLITGDNAAILYKEAGYLGEKICVRPNQNVNYVGDDWTTRPRPSRCSGRSETARPESRFPVRPPPPTPTRNPTPVVAAVAAVAVAVATMVKRWR